MLAALREAGFPHIGCDIGDPARRERIEIADVPAAMPLVLLLRRPLSVPAAGHSAAID